MQLLYLWWNSVDEAKKKKLTVKYIDEDNLKNLKPLEKQEKTWEQKKKLKG